MKRFTSLGSGMSSYQYTAKKTVWKWTPAKIAAFSMFGIMMAALVYFESTSSRTSYEPVLIQEQPNTLPPITDFEKEYQEFLKRGTKIVSQETLDSLNAAENASQNQTKAEEPTNSKPESEQPKLPIQTESPSTQQTQPATNPKANNSAASSSTTPDTDRIPENIENKLQTVEEIPPPKNKTNDDLIGVLEEASPEDYNEILNRNRNNTERPGRVITEEFYVEESISGMISAMSDGIPISGVKVSILGTDISTVSDSNGRYSITVPGDPEHRTIRYSYQGNATERDVYPGTSELNIRF